jgi:hypothetical protein
MRKKVTSESWHKKVLKARERFERGVMGPRAPVKITRKDIDRLREHMINRALRRFTLIK